MMITMIMIHMMRVVSVCLLSVKLHRCVQLMTAGAGASSPLKNCIFQTVGSVTIPRLEPVACSLLMCRTEGPTDAQSFSECTAPAWLRVIP